MKAVKHVRTSFPNFEYVEVVFCLGYDSKIGFEVVFVFHFFTFFVEVEFFPVVIL